MPKGRTPLLSKMTAAPTFICKWSSGEVSASGTIQHFPPTGPRCKAPSPWALFVWQGLDLTALCCIQRSEKWSQPRMQLFPSLVCLISNYTFSYKPKKEKFPSCFLHDSLQFEPFEPILQAYLFTQREVSECLVPSASCITLDLKMWVTDPQHQNPPECMLPSSMSPTSLPRSTQSGTLGIGSRVDNLNELPCCSDDPMYTKLEHLYTTQINPESRGCAFFMPVHTEASRTPRTWQECNSSC